MRIAVMGSGSWGTAFAMVLADAGNEVVMWGRDAELAEAITTTHENPRYHPGIAAARRRCSATTDAARRRSRGAERRRCSPCRRSRCARTSASWTDAPAPTAPCSCRS